MDGYIDPGASGAAAARQEYALGYEQPYPHVAPNPRARAVAYHWNVVGWLRGYNAEWAHLLGKDGAVCDRSPVLH